MPPWRQDRYFNYWRPRATLRVARRRLRGAGQRIQELGPSREFHLAGLALRPGSCALHPEVICGVRPIGWRLPKMFPVLRAATLGFAWQGRRMKLLIRDCRASGVVRLLGTWPEDGLTAQHAGAVASIRPGSGVASDGACLTPSLIQALIRTAAWWLSLTLLWGTPVGDADREAVAC